MYCGAGRWLGAQGARGARRRGAGHAGGTLGAQAGCLARRRQARAGGRARQTRGRARGRAQAARTAGSGVRGARGRAQQGRGRARGLALGSALGALDPFSIRFDLFFFLSHQMNTVHCKIKNFRKKMIFNKFK